MMWTKPYIPPICQPPFTVRWSYALKEPNLQLTKLALCSAEWDRTGGRGECISITGLGKRDAFVLRPRL